MNKNKIIIQITSGRGPAECCWVVAQVLKEILKEGRKQGLEMEVVHREKGTEAGTLLSALVVVSSNKSNSNKSNSNLCNEFIDSWQGSILWVGQSFYRKYHKRKNWFIGVNFHKADAKINFNINEIEFQTTKSSGPGGQHVNKTESAVRAIHKPTGISVIASDSRSQHQNKKLAIERVKVIIEQKQMEIFSKSIDDKWQKHNDLIRGNPVRTYKDANFKRV